MKLQEGNNYLVIFFVIAIFWIMLAFLQFPQQIIQPHMFIGGTTFLALTILYIYSGVALDRFWIASISKKNNPKEFYLYIGVQLLISLVCLILSFIKK